MSSSSPSNRPSNKTNSISRFFQRIPPGGNAGTKRCRPTDSGATLLKSDHDEHRPEVRRRYPSSAPSDNVIDLTVPDIKVVSETNGMQLTPSVVGRDLVVGEDKQTKTNDGLLVKGSTTKPTGACVTRTEQDTPPVMKKLPYDDDDGEDGAVNTMPQNPSPHRKNDNPFAKFACSQSTVTNHNTATSSDCDQRPQQRMGGPSFLTWPTKQQQQQQQVQIHPKPGTRAIASTRQRSGTTANKSEKQSTFVRMVDLPKEEQIRIVQKWHSLVGDASTTPLEERRYQLLLAARLHARCQEGAVRKAMMTLRENFTQGGLTVETVAAAEPEILALCITNLQYYNIKAKQVVIAAKEILTLYGGIVPEDEHSLLRITGIGKVFADLLAFVNTRKAFETTTNGDGDDGVGK